MSLEIVFAPGTANETTVDLSKDGTRLNPVRVHTGVGDVKGTIRADRSLEEHAKRQDRMNILSNGNVIWTGFCVGISHDKANATTEIQGDGIGKRLEETRPDYDSLGGPVTYQNTPLQDAIRDYWERTPFDNVTVTDQDTELVAEDALVQEADTSSEFENHFNIDEGTPITINNDTLQVTQINWVAETDDVGGEWDRDGVDQATVSDVEYSGGTAVNLPSSAYSLEYTFNIDHTIPSDSVEHYFRYDTRHDSNHVPFEVLIDGTQVLQFSGGALTSSLEWRTSTDNSPELTPGTHTLTIQPTDSGPGYAGIYFDLMGVRDARYSVTFDNTVHEDNGYLDGPELYPNGVSIETDSVTTSYNVSASRLNTTWNDTGGAQEIAVSNDGGSTYQSTSNTDTIDTSYIDPGRQVQAKFTFDRYGGGRDATPRTGFNGQSIELYEHYVDGDDLVVIDSIELSRSHRDNLDTLHEYGDFIYVIEHTDQDIADMPVSSFRRGDEQRPKPDGFDKQKNQKPAIQSGVYFNSIYLEGAKQDDGTRPTAEVKDQDAINSDDREISPGVLRDLTINTDAGAQFRAQALLDAALSNNDLVGTVTVMPMMVDPGYARPVSFSESEGEQYKTVEEVSLNISQGSADASFDFTSRTGLADDISSLRRNSKDVGDQV